MVEVTKLRHERKKRGWTLEFVGNEVGVTRQTVQRIETLKCKPSYDVLVNLEKLFDLYRCDLLAPVDSDGPFSSTN